MATPRTMPAPTKVYGLFNPLNEAKPLPTVKKADKGVLSNQPIIVDASGYRILLERPDCSSFTHQGETYKVLRFLLTADKKLYFAAEGDPRKFFHIAAHYQMTSQPFADATCLTAGNAVFNKNNQLWTISNRSGDFLPPFDSLQWVLNSIIKAKMPVANPLAVQECFASGCKNHIINNIYETPEALALAFASSIQDNILPLLTAEKSRLEREYNNAWSFTQFINRSKVRIQALDAIIKDLRENIEQLSSGKISIAQGKTKCIESISTHLTNADLDKYSGWARKLARMLLNAVHFVFSSIKKQLTGTRFFSMVGKTYEAGLLAQERLRNLQPG